MAALDHAVPRPAQLQFEDVYWAMFQDAYRLAYRLLGDRSEAEDTAQEACARAYARWSKIRDYSRPWCVRVAGNLALDRLRSLERARQHAAGAQPTASLEETAAATLRLDLYRALNKLPARQRQVVMLRYLGDVSEHDAAHLLGISSGAIKTHASRGLARLREEMPR